MLGLIIFILMSYGISNILVHSSGPFRIFEYYRDYMHTLPSNLGEGSECMICTPTQVGIILSLVNNLIYTSIAFTPMMLLGSDCWYMNLILDGGIASGSVWVLHTIQEHFEVE